MDYLTKIAVSVLFVAALALPALSISLPVSIEEIENRRIQMPVFTVSRLLDPDFYKDVVVYVRDANPVRASLIRLGAKVDLNLFDDSPDPSRVFNGRNEWLFFRHTVVVGCTTPPRVVAANVEKFLSRLQSDTTTVVFTVAPSKFTIHPEQLTSDQFELITCARDNSAELRKLLASAPIDHYVDGWELFREVKSRGAQPYFRTDTHFNFDAALPWMEALIEEISPIWDESDIRNLGTTEFQGNLMSFLGLTETERVTQVVVDRLSPVEPLDQEVSGIRTYDFTSERGLDMVQGRALIIGDSFMDLPEPSIVQYFEHVTVLDWREREAVDYFLENARQADVVIIEVSEMDVWALFANEELVDRYSGSTGE